MMRKCFQKAYLSSCLCRVRKGRAERFQCLLPAARFLKGLMIDKVFVCDIAHKGFFIKGE